MARKKYEDDDGRQIADMSGLDSALTGGRSRPIRREKAGQPGGGEEQPPVPPLSRKETFRLTVRMLLAALFIGGIFIAGAFLFILFCVHVWFR
ncbi:MAG: hypothetical protein ACOX7W_01660 [Christensenellales bacterium]|jgi:hypothetical protein